jgi:hypothetical protein
MALVALGPNPPMLASDCGVVWTLCGPWLVGRHRVPCTLVLGKLVSYYVLFATEACLNLFMRHSSLMVCQYALEKGFAVANATLLVREHMIYPFRPTTISFFWCNICYIWSTCVARVHWVLSQLFKFENQNYGANISKKIYTWSKLCNTAMKKTIIFFREHLAVQTRIEGKL